MQIIRFFLPQISIVVLIFHFFHSLSMRNYAEFYDVKWLTFAHKDLRIRCGQFLPARLKTCVVFALYICIKCTLPSARHERDFLLFVSGRRLSCADSYQDLPQCVADCLCHTEQGDRATSGLWPAMFKTNSGYGTSVQIEEQTNLPWNYWTVNRSLMGAPR